MDCKHVMIKIKCYVQSVVVIKTGSKHNWWGVGVLINIQGSGGEKRFDGLWVNAF